MSVLWKSGAHLIVRLAVMLGCCTCAFALGDSLDISQYAHTAWRVRDGFTKGFIYAIAQTPDGYLWLGTEFGLLRFDGVRAVAWTPPNGQLPSSNIPTLLVTPDGTFWIGTTKGLASWKDGKLTSYPELNGSRISALLEDRTGIVWVATDEPRIFEGNVGAINADAEGKFWVGVEKGSGKWKSGRPKSFELPGAEYGLPPLGEHEKSALLTSTAGRVPGLVNGQVRRSKASPILRDRDGGVWVGTPDRGLIHFHQGRTDVFSGADGLSGDTVTALLQDQEGSMWAVTTNGIDRFREYAVPNISIKQGLSNTNSVSIVGAKDGSVWVATNNGLNRWKDGRIDVLLRPGSSQHPDANKGVPYSLFEDSGGRLWFSTILEFGYLRDGRFVPVREVPGGRVTSMAEAPSGHLWLAKQDYGLFHLSQGRVVEKIHRAALGHHDHARVVVADPSGNGVWLGFSGGGVSYFADGAIRKSYSAAHGLGPGQVNSLRFGPRGELWVATENGLSRIKNDRVTTLTSKNGIPCDAVHWTMDDADDFVWAYTACGLVQIAQPELDAWVDDPSKVVQAELFDVSDGVRTHSDVLAVQDVTKASDGRIWYLAYDGVNVIDPRHIPFNKVPPPVHVEQITVDGRTYDAENGLVLPPHVRNVAIDYTALSLVVPEKVRFRYKLEGLNRNWLEVVNDRQVQYTNLAPGPYRFRVMASNNSGVWNEAGDALSFSIAPAYYQTRWFAALLVAGTAALLWVAYQWRVAQLARQFNRTLDARLSERTRIARDLHDTLLQSFQGALLRFQSVATVLATRPDEARQRLERALDQAQAAVTEGRDAVQGLRASATTVNDLANGITAIGAELTGDPAVGPVPLIEVEVDGASRDLNPVVREEAFRIAGEALRNAVKHAEARRVIVTIHYEPRQLRLVIRDDGKGIPSDTMTRQQLAGHFGLPGMRERAAIVKGRLDVRSAPEAGMEIELRVPAAIAYGRSARSWWSRGSR